MEQNSEVIPRYSLIIPWIEDQEKLDRQIKALCAVFEKATDSPYEIVAIDRSHIKEVARDLDRIKGEIFIIIDGEMNEPPEMLAELISSFEKGADLALAGHYADGKHGEDEPSLICFGIRRSALPRIKDSPEGFGMALNILGPEAIKRMSAPSEEAGGHIPTYLKHLIEFEK